MQICSFICFLRGISWLLSVFGNMGGIFFYKSGTLGLCLINFNHVLVFLFLLFLGLIDNSFYFELGVELDPRFFLLRWKRRWREFGAVLWLRVSDVISVHLTERRNLKKIIGSYFRVYCTYAPQHSQSLLCWANWRSHPFGRFPRSGRNLWRYFPNNFRFKHSWLYLLWSLAPLTVDCRRQFRLRCHLGLKSQIRNIEFVQR